MLKKTEIKKMNFHNNTKKNETEQMNNDQTNINRQNIAIGRFYS